MEETLELGGHISLTGFNALEPGMIVVVKKIVGTYAKKFSETATGFESIALVLKSVHETKGSQKFEINAKAIVDGKAVTSSMTDRNLFIILDKVLKKVEEQL